MCQNKHLYRYYIYWRVQLNSTVLFQLLMHNCGVCLYTIQVSQHSFVLKVQFEEASLVIGDHPSLLYILYSSLSLMNLVIDSSSNNCWCSFVVCGYTLSGRYIPQWADTIFCMTKDFSQYLLGFANIRTFSNPAGLRWRIPPELRKFFYGY